MSRATGNLLLVLGLLATAGLVVWALPEDGDEDAGRGAQELDGGRPAPPAERPIPVTDVDDPTPDGAEVRVPGGDGVPRVLPPDAAIEDVRDALALPGDEPTRVAALQAAYDAITRLAREGGGFVGGIQRQVLTVEDPVARGVVLAALGANRDTQNIAWLAGRVRTAPSAEERTGALLGLTHAVSKVAVPCPTLGGIRHPYGPLPTTTEVLRAVAAFLDDTATTAASDVLVPLTRAVENDVEVAALLVVGGTRVCALYADLDDAMRARMRAGALRHAALPGAVRRVLEASK